MFKLIRKRLRLAAITCVCVLASSLGAQTMTVGGSKIQDAAGNPCSSCTISFQPANNSRVPLSFKMGGGGQVLTKPVTATVTNGVFSVLLPDTSLTSPANVCFDTTVTDNITGESVLGPGYSCVQPSTASSASVWCSGSTCNFDSYVPNTQGLTAVTTGPIGPQGPTGPTGPTGPAGGYQKILNDGTELPLQDSLNIEVGTGLEAVDDPSDHRTNITVDGSHFIPGNTQGPGCYWDGSGSCAALTEDDIAPGFSFSVSCSACATVEIGTHVTNPSFTISPSSTITSASITNTDSISSPTTLTSPYTSGVVTGDFVKHAQGSTTFTVTVNGKTSPKTIAWQPMTYAGAAVGTITASTGTVSGTSLTLGGLTGALSSIALSNQGSYTISMSSQNGVIVLQGCSHTFFQDSGHVTPILMKTAVSLTITNANGDAVSGLCGYVTVNALNLSGLTFYVN